jgi:hypothetical protein
VAREVSAGAQSPVVALDAGGAHEPGRNGHGRAAPDHPKTITVREDHLKELTSDFFRLRVFGPDRAALLAEQLPANDAQQTARRDKQAGRLRKRLRRAETAQDALIHELETPTDPHDPAARALRNRIRARFTELETERETLTRQLTDLTTQHTDDNDPALLDTLPTLPHRLNDLPPSTRQRLYQAFDLGLLYNKDTHQVSFRAVITPSTPAALTALINNSEPPKHPTSSDSLWTPIGATN